MRLIKSSFEILEQKPGLEGIYEAIERAGRTCYKSERPEGKTAKDFVDMLIKRGHLSPLEHGTVCLHFHYNDWYRSVVEEPYMRYMDNPYSKVVQITADETTNYYITTNYRVLVENGWLDDLKYLCEPTEFHEKRVGVRVNCSIGISREWNRHRALSVCEQSTRYCNHSKDKFGNELTFVIPSWAISLEPGVLQYSPFEITDNEVVFMHNCKGAETHYLGMLHKGFTPQQAREVLPLATATEVVYTGYVSDWEHFFDMRCDNAAHPDMRAIAIPLKEEFIKRDLL